MDTNRKKAHQFNIRIPIELLEWVKDCAQSDNRSATAQIIHILKKEKALSVPAPRALDCKSHMMNLGVTHE